MDPHLNRLSELAPYHTDREDTSRSMAENRPPKREEIRTLYLALFSFPQLKGFITSG